MSDYEEMQASAKRQAEHLGMLVAISNGDMDDMTNAEIAEALECDLDDISAETDEDGDETRDESAASETARERLNDIGLDFYLTGEKRSGEWEVTGWVYLLGTGGPHFELRDDGYVHGWGWFGSDRVRAAVDSSVTDYFEGIAEMLED